MTLGYIMSHQFAKLIFALREPFKNVEQLLNDSYWIRVKNIFVQEFKGILFILKNYWEYLRRYYIFY